MDLEMSLSEEEIEVSAPVDPNFCECDADPSDPPAQVCTYMNGQLIHCL